MLGLLTPEPTPEAGEDWVQSLFPRGAYVYQDHGALWRTAQLLELEGSFAVPEDCRRLVEAVYGPAAEEAMPEALAGTHLQEEGKRSADKSLARYNAVDFHKGYCWDKGDWQDDVKTPTRLGEPTVTLRLVRRTPLGYEPWHREGPEALRWELSQVQAPARLATAEDEAQEELHLTLRTTMMDEGRYCFLVVMEEREDGNFSGQVVNKSSPTGTVLYSPRIGLRVEKEGPQ